jgi:DNA-binding transcriptional ArsR family regulator
MPARGPFLRCGQMPRGATSTAHAALGPARGELGLAEEPLDRSEVRRKSAAASVSVLTAGTVARRVEGSILALLEHHGSLGYEQIAAHLRRPPDAVRNALTDMREHGLIEVLSVGELQSQLTTAASYWRLSDAGRAELARLRGL